MLYIVHQKNKTTQCVLFMRIYAIFIENLHASSLLSFYWVDTAAAVTQIMPFMLLLQSKNI